MNTEKTLDQLVAEHAQRSHQLVQDALSRFDSPDTSKVKAGFTLFVFQNAPKLTSDLARSGTDSMNDAILLNLTADIEFIQAIKTKTLEAVAFWQSACAAKYESLPDAE